ncbi:Baseplate_J domain-containing protein (plasmid) [Rhodovastum atsumiense]|uniref:Baseplate protein J-like barrel domain-containing protein n=1 Tax=Rhodovastum atsumiense TaxID=504468 RepID=A0A5M6ITD2_9PROT|nr:baseplate J/gp47 family protein [Rhodovastum atsumiense]KAA5611570.1 hypothetical protein F1189_13480 [Rhodovastum atsumiense]CAH2606347.1 Baseplate_J domain-containing protein [Rhodovastum atsumiense]
MAFRIKPFLEITASMIGHMRAVNKTLTDYAVGSVARTMIEAPAAEIDELYQAFAAGLVEAIPTAIYRSFDFSLQPAKSASGVVRLYAQAGHNAPVAIPVGFLVASSTAQYQTAEAASIPVGQEYVDVLAVCRTPGAAGNAGPDEIRYLVTAGYNVVRVTNPAAFANGRGVETEAERKLRFVDFVRSLARGTIGAVVFAAKQAVIIDRPSGIVSERVARVQVDETPGHVDMYVHNGTGNVSDALLARVDALVQGYIDPYTGEIVTGYRPTGMRVDVHRMGEIPVDARVQAEVAMEARSEALRARIAAAMASTISAVPNDQYLMPLSLQNAAMTVPGVRGAVVVAPTLTILCPLNAVLVPGTMTVDWR